MRSQARSPIPGVFALAGGIALAWAVVGLFLIAVGVGQILAWAHRVPADAEHDARGLSAGWVAVLILGAAVITGGAFGLCTIDLLEETLGRNDPAFGTTALLAPLAAGLLFAPLAFAPSLALESSRSPWLVEAVWLAAHRGPLRTALVGLALGAHVAGPIVLGWACAEWVDDDLTPLALAAGGGAMLVLAPISLRLLAREFERARERAADPANAERALGALGRLAALPLAVLGLVLAVCAATPARARTIPADDGGAPLPLRLPGTHVTIDTDYFGIVVDGPAQASFRVPVEGWIWEATAIADPILVDDRQAWRVRVSAPDAGYQVVLDDEGRRLDDGMAKRILSRVPDATLGLLALACLLGVGFAVQAGRLRATVRTLARVVAAGSRHDVTAGTLALRGTTARLTAGALTTGPGVAIETEGGALRIALPDAPVRVLAVDPSAAQLTDGTPVWLVSQGARLGGVGLRDASAPFPSGGALVIGDPEAARAAMVRASFPVLVRLGLAIGALVVAATLALGYAT